MNGGSKRESSLIGIVDCVRSLHNVGAIFRSADGAGMERLVLCGITGCPPRPEIRKAALGAEESVPWHYEKLTLEAIATLRAQGYYIIALEKTDESIPLYDVEFPSRVAIIVSNEFDGMSPEVSAAADVVAHLPMYGNKVSLNVSVAFGIAVYEIRRRLPLNALQ